MALIAEIKANHVNTLRMDSKIASNSLAAVDGKLCTLTGGYVALAGAGLRIEGVLKSNTTFASDNITVAKAKVLFVPEQEALRVKMTADGAIAQADIGKWYNITAAQLIDQSTGTLTKTSALNMKLEEVLTATTGIFSIDNDMV